MMANWLISALALAVIAAGGIAFYYANKAHDAECLSERYRKEKESIQKHCDAMEFIAKDATKRVNNLRDFRYKETKRADEAEEWLNKMKTNTGDVIETGYGEIRVSYLQDGICKKCPCGGPNLSIEKNDYHDFFKVECQHQPDCYLLQHRIKTVLAEKKEGTEND